MHQYLVMLRHDLDDIPLLLTSNLAEATEFAGKVNANDGEVEKKLLYIDATTPLSVYVYTFAIGRLVDATRIKNFD